MANRKIYNQEAVYVGLSSSSSPHFMDFSGNLTNSIYSQLSGGLLGYSQNLLYSLTRVVNAEYAFNENRIDIKSLGNFGTLSRPIITTPPISLSLTYYSNSLINEYLLGFSLSSGSYVTPISGFLDRTNLPALFTDKKNIFITTNSKESDFNSIIPVHQTLNGTTGDILKDGIHIYAFGDCCLDSWKYSAAVGKFPQVDTSFTCENIMYYSGGSGNNIPSVNPKDFSLRTGFIYNLPPVYTGLSPTILLPGDIITNISEANGNNTIQNLPISFTDIKLQSFNIDLTLNREPLNNLGYRIPLDRRINPPVFANLSFSAIVGDSETGSLINFINNDTKYNIDINMKYSNLQPSTGIGIAFSFLGVQFNGISMSDSINEKRLCNFSFTSELKSNDVNNGFFISGQLGGQSVPPHINFKTPSTFTLNSSGVSYNQINLNWTPSTSPYPPINYSLYRGTNINFYPSLSNIIATGLTGNNYSDAGLNSNSIYYYYNSAIDSNGLSINSNESSGQTLSIPPMLSFISPSGYFSNFNFNLNLFGSNFTNFGNEVLSISGYGLSSGTGLTFINSASLIRSGLALPSGIYSLTYISNNGSSTLSSGLTITSIPPVISNIVPTSITSEFSINPFSIDITGQYFTNFGNEIFFLSGVSGTTGKIFDASISYINTGHIQVFFSGQPENSGTREFSTNYINNNGKSNNNINFEISNCTPASITGLNPNLVLYSGSGFSIDFFGNNFTNNGNEILVIQNNGIIYNSAISYINTNHILSNFNTGNYNNGIYSGYYINNCNKSLFTGLTISNITLGLIPIMTSNTLPTGLVSSNGFIFAGDVVVTNPPAGANGPDWSAFGITNTDGMGNINGSGYWASSTIPSAWIQYQFPINRIVTSYSLNVSFGIPCDFVFQSSNDGTVWTTLDSHTSFTFTQYLRYTFNILNTNNYLYYRLSFSNYNSISSYMEVFAIQMYGY